MADVIFKSIRSILKIEGQRDFFSDQIHHQISFTILIISAVASTSLQFYADPIQCIQPAQFTEGYTSFARTLCWLNNTYFYPQSYTRMPIDRNQRSQQTLHYYQWIPLIYLIEAFFFLFPYLIWIGFYQKNGLSPRTLINQAVKYSKKREISKTISKEIERYLMCRQLARCKRKLLFRQNLNNDTTLPSSPLILPKTSIRVRSHGCYLVILYLFVKLLYLINIVCQFFILDWIVSTGNYGFISFGFDTFNYLSKLSLKQRLSQLSHKHQQLFPFVTLCDFHIRELGQDHFYTIECILLINIFYEKIFFFLWIWFSAILLVSMLSLINSMKLFIPLRWRHKHLSKLIELIQSKHEQTISLNPTEPNDDPLTESFRQFASDPERRMKFVKWMQLDGAFLFHLIEYHAGQSVTVQTLEDLIHSWMENYEDQSRLAERLLRNQFHF